MLCFVMSSSMPGRAPTSQPGRAYTPADESAPADHRAPGQPHRGGGAHRIGQPARPTYRPPRSEANQGPYSPPQRGDEADWFGPEFDEADRGHRRAVLISVPIAVVAIGAVAAGVTWAMWPASHARSARAESAPSSALSNQATTAPPPTPTPTPTSIPDKGAGTYTTATGTTKRIGHGGKLVRYSVRVEDGLNQNPEAFARTVDTILAAPHGWTMAGTWSFQRVSSGPQDFVVTLASPTTSAQLCAGGGMQTGGEVNCSAPTDVVINLKRWVMLTPYYQGKPDLYHALAIDHEVGHRLGFGHMDCPGKGKPAPVMMQQIFGLHGCVLNGYPYDAHGRLITGPPVP